MAYVAAQTSNGREALRLADQAVELNPQLTWVYVSVYNKLWGKSPDLEAARQGVIERLEAWDHDNAFPYLLEAGEIVQRREPNFPKFFQLDRLASETAWRQAMAKAFAAPRFDSYERRWFELNRTWLREHGLAKPTTLYLSVAAGRVYEAMSIKTYADVLTKELGKKAEEAGRGDEALSYYWAVAHMGERLHLQAAGWPGQMAGEDLQIEAYERLTPLLRRAGRTEEAASLDYTLAQLREGLESLGGKDLSAQSSNYEWAGLLTELSAGLVVVFGFLTLLSLVLLLAKRWVRPEKRGPLFRLAEVSRPYLSVLLFLACLGFYLSYYPYAANFHRYMAATGEIHDLNSVYGNIFPGVARFPGSWGVPLGNPFRPYVWYALTGLTLAVLATVRFRRRA